MEALLLICVAIFLGVGAFIIPWIALGMAKQNTSKTIELENNLFFKLTSLEKKLAELERRLKITEALRSMPETVAVVATAPAQAIASMPIPSAAIRERAKRLIRKALTSRVGAAKILAASRKLRKIRRANRHEQFLLSTFANITPVVEEKPFVAELVQPQEFVPSPKAADPALLAPIESFIEQRIAAKAETPQVIKPTVKREPVQGKIAAPQTAAAYALDEDHDLKPSRFAGEQASLDYLELLLGRKVLGWVAAIAMILSAVFLINYTAQRFTMPPGYRVASLFGLGLGLIAFGFRYYLVGWKRFSRMLTSTGVIISFLAGYAAYGYYHLIPSTPAFLLMSVVVIGSFLLAYGYRSILIGVHAIIGGLAVPLLVKGAPEMYPQLFAYLFLLNLGTVLLLNTLHRLPIGLLAMIGTQLEFFFWYLSVGTIEWNGREFLFSLENADCVQYAITFQLAFYLLYLVDTSFGTISKRFRTTWDDTVRAILAPMIGFGWVYILYHQDPVMGEYIGLLAFIGAAWYALVHQLYVGFTRKRQQALSV